MYCYDPGNGCAIYRTEPENQKLDPLAGAWIAAPLPPQYEIIPDEEAQMYLCALETARRAHKGQTDKAGKDYISHPVKVSSLTRGSFAAVTGALLHDVIEDTEVTYEDLKNLGMSERVLACVEAMTHRENETREDYIARIAKNYDAVCVKLADLTHNSDLSRIAEPRQKDYRRVERYRREYEYLSSVRRDMEERFSRHRSEPHVVISRQGRQFLEKGQMWMYANNAVYASADCQDGGVVCILAQDGTFIARGFYSPCSHVTVRILSRDENEIIDREFFRRRIREAVSFRRTVERNNIGCCRMIFSEADRLPGLVADRYNDVLVTQISNTGFEKIRDMIYEILLEEVSGDGIPVRAVYERNDIPSRAKEGLRQYTGFWNGTSAECPAVIEENGLKLYVDYISGQKTGYFLDQKSNRLLVRKMACGHKVLDCFTHTGGFALNAAMGEAEEVTAVDVSAAALEQGLANAKLNHLENRMRFVQADVFEYLDSLEKGQFDFIILDPPAFTKSRKTVLKAYNGYKRINRRAMELLANGGYLATCSCSRYMETALFEQMLKEAAAEAGVILRQVSVTQQNADHPILWLMDETSYLKFFIFQII